MRGHATDTELVAVQALERVIDPNESATNEVLELASYYIEPCHEEDHAAELCLTVLKREPANGIAAIWYGYCCLYALMERKWLESGRDVLQLYTSDADARVAAAALMLVDRIEGDLDRESLPEGEVRLRRSVELEPGWAQNRASLAWVYWKLGKKVEACKQLECAIRNAGVMPATSSHADQLFEEVITDRSNALVAGFYHSGLAALEQGKSITEWTRSL